MNKTLKLFARILVMIFVVILISFGIKMISKIKQNNNLKNTEGWNWEKENSVIYKLLNDKYPSEDNENFMMVMRKDEDIPPKKENEKRILVVGDSFVYGYGGTNVNYTWWKQLNLQIKEAGYNNVNIYGAGRFFLNTKDELERILKNENLMKKINPDLIIIGYVYNDPEERDETNRHNLVLDSFEVIHEQNNLYKKSPTLYYGLLDKVNSLDASEYDELKSLGNLLGFYRWDLRQLIISEGERLEKYKKVLKETDDYIKSLNIPYFYFFLDNLDNSLIKQAYNNVYNLMKDLKITSYYEPFKLSELLQRYDTNVETFANVNIIDSHPGIVWNYEYGEKAYNILKSDYSFIFDNAEKRDVDELKLNINDTMPFIKLDKKSRNVFEFEYPKNEIIKDEYKTNFLYYPLEKDYIKLNLEYPKEISKVLITGENIKNVEVYVNTIDEEYGFDINEARGILTPCKKIGVNEYEVDHEITSVNIVADFKTESNRKIRIEFVEK